MNQTALDLNGYQRHLDDLQRHFPNEVNRQGSPAWQLAQRLTLMKNEAQARINFPSSAFYDYKNYSHDGYCGDDQSLFKEEMGVMPPGMPRAEQEARGRLMGRRGIEDVRGMPTGRNPSSPWTQREIDAEIRAMRSQRASEREMEGLAPYRPATYDPNLTLNALRAAQQRNETAPYTFNEAGHVGTAPEGTSVIEQPSILVE